MEAAHKGPKHLKVERVERKTQKTKHFSFESITVYCKGTIGAQYKNCGRKGGLSRIFDKITVSDFSRNIVTF